MLSIGSILNLFTRSFSEMMGIIDISVMILSDILSLFFFAINSFWEYTRYLSLCRR